MTDAASSHSATQTSAEVLQAMCAAAQQVAKHSFSPYSGYRVGAAVRAGGHVYTGTNIENTSFPAGVCAERIALGAAVSAGDRESITAIAVYAEADGGEFAGTTPMPCGICLQWLDQLAPQAEIFVCAGEEILRFELSDLFKVPFGRRHTAS
jgi:cytidine deaminase